MNTNKPRIKPYDNLCTYTYGDLVEIKNGSTYIYEPAVLSSFSVGVNPVESSDWKKYDKPRIRAYSYNYFTLFLGMSNDDVIVQSDGRLLVKYYAMKKPAKKKEGRISFLKLFKWGNDETKD